MEGEERTVLSTYLPDKRIRLLFKINITLLSCLSGLIIFNNLLFSDDIHNYVVYTDIISGSYKVDNKFYNLTNHDCTDNICDINGIDYNNVMYNENNISTYGLYNNQSLNNGNNALNYFVYYQVFGIIGIFLLLIILLPLLFYFRRTTNKLFNDIMLIIYNSLVLIISIITFAVIIIHFTRYAVSYFTICYKNIIVTSTNIEIINNKVEVAYSLGYEFNGYNNLINHNYNFTKCCDMNDSNCINSIQLYSKMSYDNYPYVMAQCEYPEVYGLSYDTNNEECIYHLSISGIINLVCMIIIIIVMNINTMIYTGEYVRISNNNNNELEQELVPL